MENQKIKHRKSDKLKKVSSECFSYKKVAKYSVVNVTVRKNISTSVTPRIFYYGQECDKGFSKNYFDFEYPSAKVFDGWCSYINDTSIDFRDEFDPSIIALEQFDNDLVINWKHVLSEFMEAIKDYKEQQKELDYISEISKESARRLLWLAPILTTYNPRIYIDATNGCFNIDISTRDNGVLSSQISENGHIYYSYVAENTKIFKITGTAKFKNSKDFIKFNKILRML